MLLNLQTQPITKTLARFGCSISGYTDGKGEHYTLTHGGAIVFLDICTTARTLYSVRANGSVYADYFGYNRNRAIAEAKRLLGL